MNHTARLGTRKVLRGGCSRCSWAAPPATHSCCFAFCQEYKLLFITSNCWKVWKNDPSAAEEKNLEDLLMLAEEPLERGPVGAGMSQPPGTRGIPLRCGRGHRPGP